MKELTQRIAALIAPSIEHLGYDLVRVHFTGGRHGTLQIMAERTDGVPMTVDDCAEISRTASALLDVEDPIPGAYTLEVSSPGIDRPLVRPKDFERFAGDEVRIELEAPADGRRRFTGTLLGLRGDSVVVATEAGETELPLTGIAKARLVLTDALIARAQAEADARAAAADGNDEP